MRNEQVRYGSRVRGIASGDFTRSTTGRTDTWRSPSAAEPYARSRAHGGLASDHPPQLLHAHPANPGMRGKFETRHAPPAPEQRFGPRTRSHSRSDATGAGPALGKASALYKSNGQVAA